MTAKMALAVGAGAIIGLALLMNGQGIEFRADQDRRAAFTAVIDRRHAMAAKIGEKPVGFCLRKESADAPSGLLFLPGNFRMAVQIMAKLDEIEHVLVGQKHLISLQVGRLGFSAATYRAMSLMQNLWRMPALARRFRFGGKLAFESAIEGGQSTVKSDAAYGQSLAYLRMGLTDHAAVSATKSRMDRPRATELQVSILADRAVSAFQSKRYSETLLLLDQRARLADERTDLMVLRGYSYLAMRRYGEAAQIFESLTAIGNQDGIKGLAAVRSARPSNGPQGGG